MEIESEEDYQSCLIGLENKGLRQDKKEFTYSCRFHRWANTPEDFMDVILKKSQRIVNRCRYCEREKLENRIIQKQEWETEKQNLTDYYIRQTFVRGAKNPLPMKDYPQELIDAKRAVIKLKREAKRLNEPLKTCCHHGKLYIEDVIKSGKSKAGAQRYKCKKCMQELHHRHYELNKIQIKNKHKKYREENRERCAQVKRDSRLRNKIKNMSVGSIHDAILRHKIEIDKYKKKLRDKGEVAEITDQYVKRKLKYKTNLKNEDIPQVLIEAKRALILLRRGVRKKQDELIFNLIEGKGKNGED